MMKPEKFPPGSTRQSQRCQIPPEKEELCGAGVKVALVDWKQILGTWDRPGPRTKVVV